MTLPIMEGEENDSPGILGEIRTGCNKIVIRILFKYKMVWNFQCNKTEIPFISLIFGYSIKKNKKSNKVNILFLTHPYNACGKM